jgi:YcaO domain protein
VKVLRIDATDQFMGHLAGVTDPEQKRKIIGREFVEVFQAKSKQADQCALAGAGHDLSGRDRIGRQGQEGPDHQEPPQRGRPAGNPEPQLLEPLRELFKDEVRKLGVALGLPHDMVYRHPFPGPGLGVRILGEVKREFADLLREADAIFIEELRNTPFASPMVPGIDAGKAPINWYEATSQAFAVFLPVKSVGVMGDGRTYEYVVALRAVQTLDFMTAQWAHLPHDLLGRVSNRIINEVRGLIALFMIFRGSRRRRLSGSWNSPMEIKVNFLDKLRLEAKFDDFTVIADQPIRYKGDGSAPGPFDYFLASSALCAAYFVKLYCNTRNIPTENIRLSQNNIVDPENRYQQIFKIQVELPADISDKDRQGILRSIDRCTVKKVVQAGPEFVIEEVENLDADAQALLTLQPDAESSTYIAGKDLPLEQTIANMSGLLAAWASRSKSLRGAISCRMCGRCISAMRIRRCVLPMARVRPRKARWPRPWASTSSASELQPFLCRRFWGEDIANAAFVHYPNERWFKPGRAMRCRRDPRRVLPRHLRSGWRAARLAPGRHQFRQCGARYRSLPYVRHSDGETVYFPSNLIENLYASNGMSAGNTLAEAQVQCLSEIFERAVKREILEGELALPDVPQEVLAKYPGIVAGIQGLEEQGFPVLVKDASLGGTYPVMCVTLMNPRTGGVFASFGAHPSFEVALERSLTELLQGRSFEGLNDLPPPTFASEAVTEPYNFVEHFIDSSGVVSWRFFSAKADFDFVEWDFSGQGKLQCRGSRNLARHSRRHGQGSVHGGVRPAGRRRLPHPGAGLFGNLSGRRPGLG